MFTGIIEEIGTVKNIRRGTSSAALEIQCSDILNDIHSGDSIAVNGVCLTVTGFTGRLFTADVMHETLNRSALGNLRPGSSVNLERAMAADGRFGGHIVSGHIDGTAVISDMQKDDNAVWYTLRADRRILRYIIEKGSVAIDGISLTVAKVTDNSFSVSVIPHTSEMTILSKRSAGDTVNIENDCIGKYVEQLLQFEDGKASDAACAITRSFLTKNGF